MQGLQTVPPFSEQQLPPQQHPPPPQQPSSSLDRPSFGITSGAGAIQNRLEQELMDKGFRACKFVRAPHDYYDQVDSRRSGFKAQFMGGSRGGFMAHFMCGWHCGSGGGGLVTLTSRFTPSCLQHLLQPLEFRMACVGAASTGHLCKSMIMENTRAHPSVEGWSNPLNSRYYVVIVQYTARLHPDKIKNFVHKLGGGLVRSATVAGPGQQRRACHSRGLGNRGRSPSAAGAWGHWALHCPPDPRHNLIYCTLLRSLSSNVLYPPPVCTRLASSSSTCG